MEASPLDVPTISLRALQRSRTTLADFCSSYFPYVGLRVPEDLFKHFDILVYVEATIYKIDEDNEALAKQGEVGEGRQLLAESVLAQVLSLQGLLDDRIRHELAQGDAYFAGERRLCAAMQHASCGPRGHPPPQQLQEQQLQGQQQPQEQQPQEQQPQQEQGQEQGQQQGQQQEQGQQGQQREPQHEQQQPSAHQSGMALADVLAVHESKSFDYRVLHLLLWRLVGRPPEPPSLLEFLRVDELLVDIRDDLVDYEEDVVRNAFNILRCFVHLYGQDAPLRLVQRISTLEAQHAQLLLSLPPHLQAHHRARHQQAAAEDASCGGAYEFPPLILDEPTFRLQIDSSSSNSSDSVGGGGRNL